MPAPRRKGRRADPSKDEAILEASSTLFMERGYAVSLDEIAAAAGVSKQTIYARYACKHDLLAAVVHQVAEEIVGALKPGAAGAGETLAKFGEGFVEVVFDTRRVAMLRLIIAESAQFPELAQRYYESGPAFVRTQLAAYLEGEMRAGRLALADTRAAASQFLGLIMGADHLAALMGLLEAQSASGQRRRVRAAVDAFITLYAPR